MTNQRFCCIIAFKGGVFVINILLCDDDKSILEKVKSLICDLQKSYKIEFNIDMRTCGDFIFKEKHSYDIAIVDIEMPAVNGLEVSERLKQLNPDIIIMILTSYPAYLDSAMKIQVFRYLSKPIDSERFRRNFLEAVEYHKKISKSIIIEKYDEIFTVKTRDILYIENRKHGSVIFTKDKSYETNKKPAEWYEIINQPNCFVQSHKSYLVNLQNVINFDKSSITFQCADKSLTVHCISQRKYAEFRKAFFDFAGGIV